MVLVNVINVLLTKIARGETGKDDESSTGKNDASLKIRHLALLHTLF